MLVQHYGSLIASIVFIAVSLVASYYVLQLRRRRGGPRWPLMMLFGTVAVRGVAFFLVSIHRSTAASAVEILSMGSLWIAVGAVFTQWFHETVLLGSPVRR